MSLSYATRPPQQPAFSDLYATSPQEDQLFPDYLSSPLYDTFEDFYDLSAEDDTFASLSPISPASPVLADAQSPKEPDLNDLVKAWSKANASFDIDSLLKVEPVDSPFMMSALPAAVNPMDISDTTDGAFRSEGLDNNEPLFQTFPSLSPSYTLNPVRTSLPAIPSGPLPPLSSFMGRRTLPPRPTRQSLKRKSSSDDSATSSPSPTSLPSPLGSRARTTRTGSKDGPGGKKTSHNMIEKRYRNNLNDKIAALRDSVPALRVMVRRVESQEAAEEDDDDEEDGSRQRRRKKPLLEENQEELCGLEPAMKLNKATILNKATEYIAHLEKQNQALEQRNAGLETRVRGLEAVVMGGTQQTRAWV